MFVFGRNTNKSWALWIGALLFLADLGTDVVFKSGGNWGLVPVATIESLFIFTLGSEVMFTIAGGVRIGKPQRVYAGHRAICWYAVKQLRQLCSKRN